MKKLFFVMNIINTIVLFFNFSAGLYLIPICLFVAVTSQLLILTEFSVPKKVLICIGNAVGSIGMFFCIIYAAQLLHAPQYSSVPFSGMGKAIIALAMGYLNYIIVFPILLTFINQLKQKGFLAKDMAGVSGVYILITFIVEMVIVLLV